MNLTLETLQQGKVLLFNKPLDWTSFDVVNKVKWKIIKHYKIKKIKVGHAGTLDPKATGLLIVCTGKATKTIETLQGQTKEYIATLKLGVQTPSYDTETVEMLPTDFSHITAQHIEQVIPQFVGEILQKPPIFSAIRKDGKRLYELAREGHTTEITTRSITIHSINIETISLPFVTLKVVCGKGTYIRSLANDIGEALQVGAYLTELCRTKIGNYNVEDAMNPEDFIIK